MPHRMMEQPISYQATPTMKRQVGNETLLTPEQVAEIMGLQRNTIYNWVKIGKLNAVKLPGGKQGKLRFRRDYIETLIGGAI